MPSHPIESFADLPLSDLKVRRLGLAIVAVTFGLFGTWAAFAPLDGAVYAPGVVTVQAYRKTVQHPEGGIVKEVLAHDGDIVKRDAPLIVLDDAQLRFEYEMTRSQLIAAEAMEARLKAERDSRAAIDFEGVATSPVRAARRRGRAKPRSSMPARDRGRGRYPCCASASAS